MLLALGVLIGCSQEQGSKSYPSGQITIVVPYPPGGFNDTLARTVGQKLNEAWGRPVIVENRPGGGTTIGTNLVARARADGHTLLVVSFAFGVNPSIYPKLPYDTLKDFKAVVLAAGTPNILVVNPELPVKSMQELIALARAKPGSLNYASAGSGSSPQLSMELLKSLTGTELVHVPYRGSVPAVTDLIGGQVQLMFDNTPNVMPHVKAGRLRALAVSSKTRSKFSPELPTVDEAGVPGFDVSVWFGFVAPGKTPKPVIEKLNGEINRILALPDVAALFQVQGVEPLGGTPEDFAAFIRGQIAKWRPVVSQAGIRAE
ncbi:MAG: tripartite tricarboxylate transporter substrate binding protein [Burkholderiales bacterium]